MFMTYELLAQEKYREMTHQPEWKEMEGVVVLVPHILDRVMSALRTMLGHCAQTVHETGTQLAPTGVAAK